MRHRGIVPDREGQTVLDEHQVRTWTSWYRWTTLVLLAHMFLASTTAAQRAGPGPAGLIPLTLNEIRHLFTGPGHHARQLPGGPSALVMVATTPLAPRPADPLPAAIRPRTMKNTIYHWITRW